MPWDESSFAKHNRGFGRAERTKAAHIANAVLKRTGDEGMAIATANKLAKRATGGSIWDQMPPVGLLKSPIAGRTDHIPLAPESDSYVIPADVVSGLGQGNSMAGGAILDQVFGGPQYVEARRRYGGAVAHRARGGQSKVPILAAGGEYVVPPYGVIELGGGDAGVGHRILDAWVKKRRKETISEMAKLPGPAK